MNEVSVYLNGVSIHLRPRAFEWTYVETKIPRISEWAPDIRFIQQESRTVALRANYKTARAAIGRRIGLPLSRWEIETDRLDLRELAASGCDMVFSSRVFPINCSDRPIVWMHAIVDPEMTKSYFRLSDAVFDEEVEVKSELFRRATIVQVCTEAEAARHARTFPDIADRFVPVPLFAPHIQLAPESILEKHRKAAPVRLLFVGNDARRKGLQETVDAYASLPETVKRNSLLTIVSRFNNGGITIPSDPRITAHRGLPQAEVVELMRASHVLVDIAHHESYGLIFPEAMSQGMLCLGPDWEVQRELFDYGRAGINVRCDTALVRAALLRAIEDEEHRTALAAAGWRRFNKRYSPAAVASKYADLFRTVAAGSNRHEALL